MPLPACSMGADAVPGSPEEYEVIQSTFVSGKRYLACLVLAAVVVYGNKAIASTVCGAVSIASMNWASAELIAEVDKLILSEGYGCAAEIYADETMPTFTSMIEKGEPDLTPELWINAVREPLDAAVAEGKLVIGAEILADGGEEGWWIPKYIADANPGIRTATDALARPDLFPSPDDDSRGAVHNCPPGWQCQITTSNLYRAYDADRKGFDLVDTGSAAALDGSIAKAYQRQIGWLGYFWAPTATLGRYEMVKLDMGAHDGQEWESCTAVPDCANPKINGWARNEVFSVVTKNFTEEAAVAMDYISSRNWKNEIVNVLLAWMSDNQATGAEAAIHFIENYEGVWGAWVPEEIVSRVKASL